MKTSGSSRSHGFQRPFNSKQIVSWILFLFEVATSYIIFLPPLNTTLRVISINQRSVQLISLKIQIVAGVVFGLSQLFTIFFAYKATKVDPTDPAVIKEKST